MATRLDRREEGARPTPAKSSHALPKLSEEECLDEVMRVRFGGVPCKACGRTAGYTRETRRRAFSCRSCGLKVFPCHGTPFEKPRPALDVWFGAIYLDATGRGQRLRRELGVDAATAREMAAAITGLRAIARARRDDVPNLFEPIAAFVAARADQPAGMVVLRPETDGETLWDTLRATIRLPEIERRPVLGVVAIGAFMLAGAGIGWLLVPNPEATEEFQQATAILTLGEERPVIVVTPDVAAQLYDVTDVDAEPGSPLASSIRVASNLDKGAATPLANTRPIAAPAIKLSGSLGKSLAEGDTGGAKERARNNPELAAYDALAIELEGSGPRNPDELLTFGPMRIRRHLVEKIVRAAKATTTDPVLLMAIADKESSFQTEVQAKTSSASGLFQFIERTWLDVLREFGPKYGYQKEAQSIASGDLPAAERTRILDMRRDAYLSSVLAAEMLKRDSMRIARRIGRNLTGGEIYLVHFLGADGAERFLDQMAKKPDAVAADLLPKPAAANRPIFYTTGSSGEARGLSVSEVRGKFETMISLRLDRYRTVKGVQVSQGAPSPPAAPKDK